MWFGLENSEILRYADGDWTLFDTCSVHFTNHYVRNAATAPNGDQWFSIASLSSPNFPGLARYSADGQWQFFSSVNAPLTSNFDIRKIIFEADGTAWFATTFGGILRYDGATWETFTVSNSGLPSDKVFYIALAPDGAIWAATADSGLVRFDGQNWTIFNTSNSGLPSNSTSRIAFDKAGGMYVGYGAPGIPGARVVVLRGGVWTELVPPGWENSSNDEPDAFIVDSKNRLWFAEFYDPGVYRYDPMLVNTHDVFSTEKQIHVFPNPASDVLHLQIPDWKNQPIQLRVTDTFGRQIFHQNLTSNAAVLTLELPTDWPAGIYYLEAINERGERQTGRFVRAMPR